MAVAGSNVTYNNKTYTIKLTDAKYALKTSPKGKGDFWIVLTEEINEFLYIVNSAGASLHALKLERNIAKKWLLKGIDYSIRR